MAAPDPAALAALRRAYRRYGLELYLQAGGSLRIFSCARRQLLAVVGDFEAARAWLGSQSIETHAEPERQRTDEERHAHVFSSAQATLARCGVPVWRSDGADGRRVFFGLIDGKPLLLLELADLVALADRLDAQRQRAQEQRGRGRVYLVTASPGYSQEQDG